MAKNLIVFFSRAGENILNSVVQKLEVGNTEVASDFITEFVEADKFKVEMVNPYHLPEAHVRYKDGFTTASDDAVDCPGNCTECACTDYGCWVIENGQQVVFNYH